MIEIVNLSDSEVNVINSRGSVALSSGSKCVISSVINLGQLLDCGCTVKVDGKEISYTSSSPVVVSEPVKAKRTRKKKSQD